MKNRAVVVGAGLAGCEAAHRLASEGIMVSLYDIKPDEKTPAHKSGSFGELVCSNSLKAKSLANASGLLKAEMRLLDSLIVRAADETQVPAGGALAVDRVRFEAYITEEIRKNVNIEIFTKEIKSPGFDCPVIIATGPLTTPALGDYIRDTLCAGELFFFDAAAPILEAQSIDMEKVFFASRYGRGGDDYINCPFDKESYDRFYSELVNAQTVPLHGFEDSAVFEGCMPVEVMARRGKETLLFGPLKPVGLKDPATGHTPYAAVQLRRDNSAGSLYSMVGFQTNLRFGEQKRVFSMIPGLARAEFVRYGVMHRNTYINSPAVLDRYYRVRKSGEAAAANNSQIFFAGQITGVEGYLESASSGLLAGLNCARMIKGQSPVDFTRSTAVGALANYISDPAVTDFQPMNINFGIMEEKNIKAKGRYNRRLLRSEAALLELKKIACDNGIILKEEGKVNEDNS